jgi:iron complex transport system substrate-binding protein
MLDAIGAVESVVGVSGKDFITNPYIATNRHSIADVGYDGNINFELLVAQQPDIVLLYGVTGACTMQSKLDELAIPYIYIGEYVEEDPLGKTEWLIALAEIVGCREQGIAYFSEVPLRYNHLKSMAAAATSPQPKVMLNTPYADSWFMPSITSYLARLIADAGGDYIYKRNTSNHSLPIDLEEAALLTTEADIWLHVEGVGSLQDLRQQYPKFADMPCVQRGEIYNCDRRRFVGGGNDYWESGVVQPDVILRDLIKIFHPELVSEAFVYYRKIE